MFYIIHTGMTSVKTTGLGLVETLTVEEEELVWTISSVGAPWLQNRKCSVSLSPTARTCSRSPPGGGNGALGFNCTVSCRTAETVACKSVIKSGLFHSSGESRFTFKRRFYHWGKMRNVWRPFLIRLLMYIHQFYSSFHMIALLLLTFHQKGAKVIQLNHQMFHSVL